MRRRFLYFIPDAGGCSEQMLTERELVSRFVGDGEARFAPWVSRAWERPGPDGRPGCLVALGSRPPEFRPDQAWLSCTAGVPPLAPEPGTRNSEPSCFVGIEDPALPPRPEDLVRGRGLNGYDVPLGDGQKWRVPLVLRWNAADCAHELAVPQAYVPRDGRIVQEPLPPYARLADVAAAAFARFVAETPTPLETLCAEAAELLAANYRVGLPECGLLGLFAPEVLQPLFGAALDLPALRAAAEEAATAGVVECVPTPDADELAAPGPRTMN
jgi:hypothetical protein